MLLVGPLERLRGSHRSQVFDCYSIKLSDATTTSRASNNAMRTPTATGAACRPPGLRLLHARPTAVGGVHQESTEANSLLGPEPLALRLWPDQNAHIVPVTYSASFDASTPAVVNATVGDGSSASSAATPSAAATATAAARAPTRPSVSSRWGSFREGSMLVERNLRRQAARRVERRRLSLWRREGNNVRQAGRRLATRRKWSRARSVGAILLCVRRDLGHDQTGGHGEAAQVAPFPASRSVERRASTRSSRAALRRTCRRTTASTT